jgi:hypothetical protein
MLGATIAAAALSIGGAVLAQDTPTPPGDPAAEPAQPAEPAPPGPAQPAEPAEPPQPDMSGQGGAKVANISAAEMTKRGDEYLKRMRATLQRVVKLKSVIEQQKDVDVLKLDCVNDKLLQIKGLLNAGEQANTRMLEAISSGDETARYDQFSILTIAHEKVAELAAEADQCVGQDQVYIGPTDVDVEGGDEPDDPTQPDEPGYPEVEIPPTSSPFV